MLAAVHALRPHALRLIAAAGAAAAALTLAAGCSSFDKAFGKQEAVVQFKAQTPASVMLRVRSSCSHVPSAVPERVPAHPPAVQLQDDIRYLSATRATRTWPSSSSACSASPRWSASSSTHRMEAELTPQAGSQSVCCLPWRSVRR